MRHINLFTAGMALSLANNSCDSSSQKTQAEKEVRPNISPQLKTPLLPSLPRNLEEENANSKELTERLTSCRASMNKLAEILGNSSASLQVQPSCLHAVSRPMVEALEETYAICEPLTKNVSQKPSLVESSLIDSLRAKILAVSCQEIKTWNKCFGKKDKEKIQAITGEENLNRTCAKY